MADDNQALLLQVSADISKLEKAFKKASGVVDTESSFMERRAKQMAKKVSDAGSGSGANGATGGIQALVDLLSKKLGGAMQDTSSQAGGLTDGLSDLGKGGLLAGAAIGALAAAFAGARAASAFADDIADTANRLHVTTDALQEYRYAIRAAGGDEAGADAALEAFSVTLGKAQAGLPKAVKAFKELGFTTAQIKGFKDADDALQQVTTRIAGLSNVQQDAVIQQLGLDGLKPLIEGGVEAMQRLREEAHKVGIVMDAELVKRGGDMNDEFETVQKVIDVQLKSALIDLGPILVGLLGLVSQMATAAADVADAFRSIQDKSSRALQNRAEDIDALLKSKGPSAVVMRDGKPLRMVGREFKSTEELTSERKKIQSLLDSRAAIPTPGIPKSTLAGTGDGGGGAKAAPRDTTGQYRSTVDGQVAGANRNMLQALLGLTDDIEARGALQKQILDQEQAAYTAHSAKLRADIEASNSTDKKAQLAQLDLADATQKQADAAIRRGIDAETQIDLASHQLDLQRSMADAQIEELRAQEDLTADRKERARIEHEILKIQKDIADQARANDRNAIQLRGNAASPDGTGFVDVNSGRVQKSADRTFGAQSAAIDDSYAGPLAKWQQANKDAVANVQDAWEELAVKGIDGFNQSLTNSLGNAKSFGEGITAVIRQALADLAAFELKKLEVGLFDKFFGGGGNSEPSNVQSALHPFIPGNANGTDNWRGGLTWVGERGKELLNLPKGAQVVPNNKLGGLANMNGLGSGGAPHIFVAPMVQLVADSSVVSRAWVDGQNAKLKAVHDSAVATATKASRKSFGTMQNNYQKYGTT